MTLHDIWPLSVHDTANVIGGAFGGAVRAAALKLGWRDTGITIAVGAVCARYLYPFGNALIDPLLTFFTKAAPGENDGLGGFIIGVLGIAVVGFFMELFRNRTAAFFKKEGPP